MDIAESIMFQPEPKSAQKHKESIHQSIQQQFFGESIALKYFFFLHKIPKITSFDDPKLKIPGFMAHVEETTPNHINLNSNSLDPNDQNYTFLKALSLIYDQNSVLYNQKIQDKSIFSIKTSKYDAKKITNFIVEVASPRHQNQKVTKAYKVLLSKIVKANGKVYLFVIDIVSFASVMIFLESLFENPCKNHIIDPQTGYAFVYDNRGSIIVMIAKISGEWKEKTTDKDRKICSLSLFDKRVDPTLHLINKQLDGSVLLFVVGGYEVPNLMQDVQVFSLNFQRNMTLQPVIRIKLRYPRLQPLIYHMKISEENDTRIYILGGTSFKSLKKEGVIIKNEFLEEGKKSCETINLKKIEDVIYKQEIVRNNETNEIVTIDKSFQISGNNKLLNKLETFSEGGVIKLRVGFHSKNKTAFIIGVGKSKGSVYHVEYVDEKGQQLHIVKKIEKVIQPGFLCNAMFRIWEKKLFFVTDGSKDKYQVVDLEMFERKKMKAGCQCNLF